MARTALMRSTSSRARLELCVLDLLASVSSLTAPALSTAISPFSTIPPPTTSDSTVAEDSDFCRLARLTTAAGEAVASSSGGDEVSGVLILAALGTGFVLVFLAGGIRGGLIPKCLGLLRGGPQSWLCSYSCGVSKCATAAWGTIDAQRFPRRTAIVVPQLGRACRRRGWPSSRSDSRQFWCACRSRP